MKAILFTRPNYDIATKYLHYFSDELVKHTHSIKECTAISLERSKVTRKEFEKILDKKSPKLLILNGHGTFNSILGHKGEVILDKDNIRKLKSKIVYAVACDSSEELGDLAVDKGGAVAYIGYEANFMVIIDPTYTTSPSKDKNAKPFRQIYVSTVLGLLCGFSVEKSVDRTKKLIREKIREYGVYGIRDKFGDAPLIRFALHWDLFFLKLHGNSKAVF